MLSHTAKYAIKALHYISLNGSEKHKLTAHEIAEITNIPKPFLSKMLRQLAQLEIISSTKGPSGGFYLNSDQLQQSVLDVIAAIEGKDRFHQCVLNLELCNADMPCPIHDFVSEEKNALRNAIRNVKLLDMSDNLNYFAVEQK